MPDPAQAEPASSLPDGADSSGSPPVAVARRPVAQSVMHDMAGHAVGPAATMRANGACSHFASQTQAPGKPFCVRRSIDVPMSMGPIVLALMGGVLIIGGLLTFFERGPGRWIKPSRRRRGATQRARRWRQRIGGVVVGLGCICLWRAFG